MKNIICFSVFNGNDYSYLNTEPGENSLFAKVMYASKGSNLEILYGCELKKCIPLENIIEQTVEIPKMYCSDGEIIHMRYVDDEKATNFIHIVGDQSKYDDLQLIKKTNHLYYCGGALAPEKEVDYLQKLAELINGSMHNDSKRCYNDLFVIEQMFNTQLLRLGGITGETVSESVQRLSDIEIPSQKGNQFLNFSAESLYIKDFIVKGVSSAGSYWKPSQEDIFRPNDKTWEIGVKILVDGTTGHSQVLFGSNSKGGFYLMPSLEVQPNSRRLWAGISFNGTAWDLGACSEKELNIGTWYYIKYLYDGTNYIVKVSTDLINWETYISFEATGLSAFLSNLMFSGIALSSAHLSTRIWFDLRWNYIKIDNEYVFGGWYE